MKKIIKINEDKNKEIKIDIFYKKDGTAIYSFIDKWNVTGNIGKRVNFLLSKKDLVKKDLINKGFKPIFIDE